METLSKYIILIMFICINVMEVVKRLNGKRYLFLELKLHFLGDQLSARNRWALAQFMN